ncbi:MAG: hypothetical protein HFI63_08495 [Lachnospiraceae bacterium]|nr:hypothetical protein [Lachnospiraceae bacterium]
MKKLREIRVLVLYNWKPLTGFALLYKLVSVLIFVPLLWGIFDLIMKAGGYAYLTLENIGAFLTDWRTVPLLLLLFILAASYAMIDISAVVFTLDLLDSWNR